MSSKMFGDIASVYIEDVAFTSWSNCETSL